MAIEKQRLELARGLVLGVLEGRISPETDPAVFEDDLLFIDTRILEFHDFNWLSAHLQDSRYSLERRRRVGSCAVSDEGEALFRQLGEE